MPEKPDKLWYTGICLLVLSSLLFFLPKFNGKDLMEDGLFFANYLIALLYLLLLRVNHRLRKGSGNLPHIFLFLNLALLSCYALNRSITLFAPSAGWWTVL